jgi:hypothetical protein
MLQTLKHHQPSEIATILAAITLSLSSEAETPVGSSIDDDLRRGVLSEIFQKLHISETAQSEAEKAKLYKFLTKEMGNAVLSTANTDEIKKQVGQRGDLRPDLYEIEIPQDVRTKASERSITISEIMDALEHPDGVEHLLPETFGVTGDAVSLYYVEWQTVKTGESSFLLVLTRRKGYKQTVNDVIRFFESDVPVQTKTPLELLQAFIERYGVPQRIGDRTAKCFLYEVVPFFGDTANFLQLPTLTHGNVTRTTCFVKFSENTVEVAIAFTINESEYLADLRKHK